MKSSTLLPIPEKIEKSASKLQGMMLEPKNSASQLSSFLDKGKINTSFLGSTNSLSKATTLNNSLPGGSGKKVKEYKIYEVSPQLMKLYTNFPAKKRQKLVLNDYEIHEGWISQVKKEKKNIIE